MANLRFGLIGTGFMGKAHAIALKSVATVFPDVASPVLSCLVDASRERAERYAGAWGFSAFSDDWQSVCADPDIDVIDICTPNHLHKEIAIAAARSGKHVYCEKPLALSGPDALEICEAAEAAGVRVAVGFNYVCNPMIEFARQLIAENVIGVAYNFRGSYQEDYLADAATPFSWRCLRREGGSGALNDLGTHLINMAEFLVGPISAVLGNLTTVYGHRPDPATRQPRDVENEDIAQVLVRFANGCTGTMEISRIATGRKCGLAFEVHGSKGSIAFDQERMNELRVYRNDDPPGQRGYRTVLAGPEHPDYANFCPAPGHGLGINDLKVIEVRNLLRAIEGNTPIYASGLSGWRAQAIVDSIEASQKQNKWISTGINE